MPHPEPVILQRPLDLSPEQLARAVGGMEHPAIVESGPGFGAAGRWSIYAARPRQRVWFNGQAWQSASDGSKDDFSLLDDRALHDPLSQLAHFETRLGLDRSPPLDHEPPFRGGLIGFASYDLAPWLERLPRKARSDSQIPALGFGLYDTFAAYDHETGAARLCAAHFPGVAGDDRAERLDRWSGELQGHPAGIERFRAKGPARSGFTREEYLAGVEQALEYIRAGDIFQVNLSQRFETDAEGDPLDLYLRLRRHCPSPFGAFLRWPGFAVVSASPEWFFQTRGRRIVTRPIKGTRPRGDSAQADRAFVKELLSSVKDRAELTMIVDLERNDLGRVCEYGSVVVTEPHLVESYAQVHHLVATVEGNLRRDATAADILRAMFPGGSITGAPKIRAMEIIDELEPTRRGLYTGSIGYLSLGASAYNILIRTFLVEGRRVSYQVGGGIVSDSVPELEYLETLHKGRGLREVLEGAGA